MPHGKIRPVATVLAAALFLAVTAASAKTDFHSGFWKLMRDANFEFTPSEETRAWQAGSITAGGKQYEIWGYAWEESHKHARARGGTEHASHGVFVLERTSKGLAIIGAYDTDGVPFRVKGRTIKFDYAKQGGAEGVAVSKMGDEIVFDDKGPPSKVLLDGEIRSFDDAEHRTGLWHVLRTASFSGPIYDAKLARGGSISAGGRHYEIWQYFWKQDPLERGKAKQPIYKALVFERNGAALSYLGAYATDGAPFRVEGRALKFQYRKADRPQGFLADEPSNEIVFEDKGPPDKARIGWEFRDFEKAK